MLISFKRGPSTKAADAPGSEDVLKHKRLMENHLSIGISLVLKG